MKTNSQILREAKALIRLKKNWCQGNSGRDSSGNAISNLDPRAVAFCAFGAVERVAGSDHFDEPEAYMERAAKTLGHNGLYINDQTDHKTVMKMFDLAIKYAEEDERKSNGNN